MSRDLQIVGAMITLAIGFGLVRGRQATELASFGKALSVASAGLLVYRAFGGR